MTKKSEASKVPFLKIPGSKLLFQVDKKLYPNINKYGCRFMSMIAIPQIITGKRLTAEGINEIYDRAVAGNLGDNVMESDCTCGANEHLLMTKAFEMLGDKDHYCRQIFVSDAAGKYRSLDMLPSKDNILFIVVDFNTTSDKRTYGGHHFVLFNAIGELIYDPAGGTVKSWKSLNRWLVYKVYSRSHQDALVNGISTKNIEEPPKKTISEPIKASQTTSKPKSQTKQIQNTITKAQPTIEKKTVQTTQNTNDNIKKQIASLQIKIIQLEESKRSAIEKAEMFGRDPNVVAANWDNKIAEVQRAIDSLSKYN